MVALLGIEGHHEDAIASRLDISPHTVRHHFKRLYVKLGVSSRMTLATAVIRALLAARREQTPPGGEDESSSSMDATNH
jgi:DNA-binding NarL/FixJ family response regulator